MALKRLFFNNQENHIKFNLISLHIDLSLLPPGTLDIMEFYLIKCIRIEIICCSTIVEESGKIWIGQWRSRFPGTTLNHVGM